MRSIKDKKSLVTGAASGIGRAIAMKLASEGAQIAALDVDARGLESLTDELLDMGKICYPILCDLTDESEIAQSALLATRRLNGLDILVNNAGLGLHVPTHEMSHEERNRILQINLNAPFALFQHLIDPLMNDQPGHVVNVSSILGMVPQQRTAAYCASKYGLVGFTEAIRAEYGRWGLGVTLVCPGFVDTPMLANLPQESASGQKLPRPSKWLTTTAEHVAAKVVRGIKRNRRLVMATSLAHFLYHSKRLLPGTFDFLQTFKTPKFLRRFRKAKATRIASAHEAKSKNAA